MSEKLETTQVVESSYEVVEEKREISSIHKQDIHTSSDGLVDPTEEDWKTLPEIADSLPTSAFFVLLIEFCERFTYYGLTGPFQNYIQNEYTPDFPAKKPGAMGRGQQTATALTTFFQFWCYITPIIGAVVADQYLGKYKTIVLFAVIYMVGLIILTCTSIPAAIESGATFGGFIVAIIFLGLGTGGIKANVSPLIAEQYTIKKAYVKTLANGSKAIVTPQATYQKIFSMFYWSINVGSLSAIATTTMEKNIGFWSAYLLPTCMFVPGIIVVLAGRNHYISAPPRGSIFVETGKLLYYSTKVNGGLDACKPSLLQVSHPELAVKATWDDIFVDELKRALRACIVFCWYPIFWLCYSQMTNNLISQAGTMLTGNVPNDIMQNIDPLVLIIAIPIMDRLVYPAFRRMGFQVGPITRISLGFLLSSFAMAYSSGIQHLIYSTGPGYYDPSSAPNGQNNVSAAYQIPAYIFTALSEVFASITGLEYAYKKAPESMKSMVMALFLFTNCVSSILAFALVPVAVDPKLEWMYAGIGIASFICSILIYVIHGKNDKTDAEDDAIGRTDEQLNEYTKHKANISEYEAEKGAL